MLKNQPSPPIVNIIASDKAMSVPKVQTAIDEYIVYSTQVKEAESYAYLSEIRFEPDYHPTMRAFGLIIVYLRNALLIDQTLKFFSYSKVSAISQSCATPIID